MSDDLDVEGPGGPKIGPCVSLSQCLPRRFEMGPDLCAQRNYLGVPIDHFRIASGND